MGPLRRIIGKSRQVNAQHSKVLAQRSSLQVKLATPIRVAARYATTTNSNLKHGLWTSEPLSAKSSSTAYLTERRTNIRRKILRHCLRCWRILSKKSSGPTYYDCRRYR